MGNKKWDFRDVSSGIAKIREILLGRKNVFHNRFPPLISPRSIPPPDIPRGPEYKYSNQWYGNRNALRSVKPPVVAPIAEGAADATKKSDVCSSKPVEITFPCPPTPGLPWWFDGHYYYVQVRDPCEPPQPPPHDPCAKPPEKPCQPPFRERSTSQPCEEVSDPCDPCQPPKKT